MSSDQIVRVMSVVGGLLLNAQIEASVMMMILFLEWGLLVSSSLCRSIADRLYICIIIITGTTNGIYHVGWSCAMFTTRCHWKCASTILCSFANQGCQASTWSWDWQIDWGAWIWWSCIEEACWCIGLIMPGGCISIRGAQMDAQCVVSAGKLHVRSCRDSGLLLLGPLFFVYYLTSTPLCIIVNRPQDLFWFQTYPFGYLARGHYQIHWRPTLDSQWHVDITLLLCLGSQCRHLFSPKPIFDLYTQLPAIFVLFDVRLYSKIHALMTTQCRHNNFITWLLFWDTHCSIITCL